MRAIRRPGRPALRIDVHAHYVPADLIARLVSLGVRVNRKSEPSGRLRDEIAELDASATDVRVVELGSPQPYLDDRVRAVEAARAANDAYAEAIAPLRRRFAAFGCVPLPHPDAAVGEVCRCLDELGFAGIGVGCSVLGGPLDDPAFGPFWAELDRRGAVVSLHPMGTGVALGGEWYIDAIAGMTTEDTVAGLRLVLSGLTLRHPRIRFIVPHLGGAIPFLWERIEYQLDRARERGVVALPPGAAQAGLRRLSYDTVNGSAAALRCACETLGSERLLFGTDHPVLDLATSVRYVEGAGLGPRVTADILDRNAQRLLGLAAR
jgi:aminocarboxymuconate-semialdehyde decarboxylase